MGRLTKFEVNYDKPMAVYFAGEMVNGTVDIILNAPMKMRQITLRLVGAAEVRWTEHRSRGGNNRSRTVTYYNSESYFDHTIQLWSEGGVNTDQLAAGDYKFPFNFVLPPNLPTSFEGTHGHVRYKAKAIIDIPWKFDKTCKVPFSVNAIYDLNRMTVATQPVSDRGEKFLCCWCCRSGPISIQATIIRMGYVPGDTVYINAEITNYSNRDVDSVKAILKAKIYFHSMQKTKVSSQEVCQIKRDGIKPGHSDIWNAEALNIPPVPPSELVGCQIIDIEYKINIYVNPSGGSCLKISLPVLIGTIPLRTSPYTQRPPVPSPCAPLLDNQQWDLPPPSYGECAFGMTDIREDDDNQYTRGKLNFAPVYTFYNSPL